MELTPIYRDITKKEWLDQDEYVTWLGAFAMPNHFSVKMAASAISMEKESHPSDSLHPAVFILTKTQHDAVLAARTTTDDGNRLSVAKVVRSVSHLSLMKEQGRAIDESIINSHVWIQGDAIGSVYMVCLKIMIAASHMWTVHFDRVHLYQPFVPSKL
jgi:hypothetical protein